MLDSSNLKNLRATTKIERKEKVTESLDSVIYGRSKVVFADQGLKLIKYEFIYDENILNKFRTKDLLVDSYIPQYNDSTDVNKYELFAVKDLDKSSLEKYSNRKRILLSEASLENLDVIELTWEYKGQVFTTKSLVNKNAEELYYDPILSSLMYITIETTETDSPLQAELQEKSFARLRQASNESCRNAYGTWSTSFMRATNPWNGEDVGYGLVEVHLSGLVCYEHIGGKTIVTKTITSHYANASAGVYNRKYSFFKDAHSGLRQHPSTGETYVHVDYAIFFGFAGELSVSVQLNVGPVGLGGGVTFNPKGHIVGSAGSASVGSDILHL